MLLVLLDLLLVQWYALWTAFLPVYRCILASICYSLANWVNFAHLNHWGFHLNGLLFSLAVSLIKLLVSTLLRALVWSIKNSSIWLLSIKRSLSTICCFDSSLLSLLLLILLILVSGCVHGPTHSHKLILIAVIWCDRSHLSTRWKCFTRCKEHRIKVVEMHLLQLGVVHRLACWKLSCSLIGVYHMFRLVVLISASFNSHKRRQRPHWPHRPNNGFAIKNLILIILHHLIPILSPWLARCNIANLLGHDHIQLLFLNRIKLALVHILRIQIGNWRWIQPSYGILKALLILRYISTLNSLRVFDLIVAWSFHFGGCASWSLYTLIQITLRLTLKFIMLGLLVNWLSQCLLCCVYCAKLLLFLLVYWLRSSWSCNLI